MLKKILISISIFSSSLSLASESCGSLFVNQKSEVMDVFQKIIENDLLLQRIEDVRRKYEGMSESAQTGAAFVYNSLLRELVALPSEKAKSESEERIVEIGIDNLFQDLANISTTQITAKRILVENASIIHAHIARERGKTVPFEVTGNIVSLSSKKMEVNSDYINARKNIFDLIDAYRILSHVKSDVLRERVEELLLADVRYSTLPSAERTLVAQQLSKELMQFDFLGSELYMEKYFSSKMKAR